MSASCTPRFKIFDSCGVLDFLEVHEILHFNKNMEALPNEPIELRKWAIEELMKKYSFREARVHEDRLHAQRCVFDGSGVPTWTYNSVTLYATDTRDRHAHEARLV
jgi:DNA-directed RNA polymerase subunit M/transcription elongation factor TFIIS